MTASSLAKNILRIHRSGAPLNISAVRRSHPELLAAAYSFTPFLGWKQALELAGLDYKSIKIELEPYVPCLICDGHFRSLVFHLRSSHGIENGAQYREEFPEAEMVSEELRASRIKPQQGKLRHWEPLLSKEYVRDRVWFWHRHYGRCNVRFIMDHDLAIVGYAANRKWPWDDVLRSVGLDPRTERLNNWHYFVSRDDIVSTLLDRHEQGLSNTCETLRAEHPSLLSSIDREFGSLPLALDAIGLPDNRLKGASRRALSDYPDKKTVLAALKTYAANGNPLTFQALRAIDFPLSAAATARFPNFVACVRQAGLWNRHLADRQAVPDTIAVEPRRSYTTASRVAQALRDRYRHGLSLRQQDVIDDDPPLKSAVYRLCGSWTQAIRQAGLEKEHKQCLDAAVRKDAVYTNGKAVTEALEKRAREGKGISQHAVSREDRPLKNAVYRYFGSWPAAIEAAGLARILTDQKTSVFRMRRDERYPDGEAVLADLRRRADAGLSLARKRIAREDSSLRYYAIAHFGSWMAALQAAGVSDRHHKKEPPGIRSYPDAESVLQAIRNRRAEGFSLSFPAVKKEDRPLQSAALHFFGSWTEAAHRAFAS